VTGFFGATGADGRFLKMDKEISGECEGSTPEIETGWARFKLKVAGVSPRQAA
jgi:hypothetical protein